MAEHDPRGIAGEPALIPAIRVQTDGRTWAIDPRVLASLCELDGQLISSHAAAALEESRRGTGTPPRAGGVMTVPLKGVLMPQIGGLLGLLFGAGGLQDFQCQLEEASNDPDVDAIVLDVDSPGGMVDHIPETAALVRRVRARKPVVAVANTQAASAAYWLASQADELSVTPSGEAGSIGVYMLHRDLSRMNAMRGIAPTLISAGRYKVEGNPYEPLGEEAREAWQGEVDDLYRLFASDVARGRRATRDEVIAGYGQGRCLRERRAVNAGLADRVETLSEAVRRVASPAGRAALERRRADGPAADDLLAPTAVEPLGLVEPPSPVTYSPDERTRLLTVLA